MTGSGYTMATWATSPLGRAARLALLVVGNATAFAVLMLATIYPRASWVYALLGVALSVAATRAWRSPRATRLFLVGAIVVAVGVSGQLI